VAVSALGVHKSSEIEQALANEQQNGGLIILANPVTIRNRDLIILLTARYRLPAMYSDISRPAGGSSHMELINSHNGGAPWSTRIAF